jgi:endoglucanase
VQWPWNGSNSQQWQLTATSPGIYKVINRNSGFALDVNGASTANGAGIIQWNTNTGTNQQWQIVQQ